MARSVGRSLLILLLPSVVGCNAPSTPLPPQDDDINFELSVDYPDWLMPVPQVESTVNLAQALPLWRIVIDGADYGKANVDGVVLVKIPRGSRQFELRAYSGMSFELASNRLDISSSSQSDFRVSCGYKLLSTNHKARCAVGEVPAN